MNAFEEAISKKQEKKEFLISLFLAGDVMTGRGIDQILPYPSEPTIHEPYLKSAKKYVEIAEEANGPIAAPVGFPYIWGDALAELERAVPDVRIINLETSITGSDDFWEDKEIHYRMNPKNIGCLTAAKIDFCSLANNHILDWGYSGLAETLETLRKAKVESGGAGRNLNEAGAPAVMEVPAKGRVIIFSFGAGSSGIPLEWEALGNKAGVNLLPDLSFRTIQSIVERVRALKRERDIVVASIHWGGNWGYEVSPEQISFAHGLIEEAGVDLIHGHSSHHVKGIEVFRGKLILYGCGDFLNDYEGISGYEAYRGDLTLMYFVHLDPFTGELVRLWMAPMQIKNFRLNRASPADARWLKEVLNREGKKFGTRVDLDEDGALRLLPGEKTRSRKKEEYYETPCDYDRIDQRQPKNRCHRPHGKRPYQEL
jgi:poly-gamma-glutamate synthesis protein (capsule biosynthesis protein)